MGGQRVLAIEHDWRLRKLIRANLEPLGLEVQEAVSGEHGFELVREGRPDLILLDLDLPNTDIEKLLVALPGHCNPPVPIIVISAEPLSRRFRQQGQAAGHLQKPFSAPALLERVRQILDRPEIYESSP